MQKARRGKLLLIYTQNAPASSELVVLAPVVDFTDPELPEGGSTHDTRFDRHVEGCVFEKVGVSRDGVILRSERWIGENVVDCFQLGVSCCLVLRYRCSALREGKEKDGCTFRSSLVLLRALAIILLSRINTQPTGTSLASIASSA